jgi:hypothetical protein
MGYDIHITRRKFWPDEGDDIEFDEFVQLNGEQVAKLRSGESIVCSPSNLQPIQGTALPKAAGSMRVSSRYQHSEPIPSFHDVVRGLVVPFSFPVID